MSALLPAVIAPTAVVLTDARLDELIEAVIRRGDSPETKRAYRYDARQFIDWLNTQSLNPGTVTPDDLDQYREWLVERGYARKTVNRRLGFVRSLYAEAERRRALPYNPAAWLRNLRGRDAGATPALSLAQARELKQILADELAMPGRRLLALRDRAMIAGIMIQGALRRSEVVALRVADLQQDGGHTVISFIGKGRVERRVKVQPEVVRWLREWFEAAELAADDPIFVRVAKGSRIPRPVQPLNAASVDRAVRHRLAQLGVEGPLWGAHAMRATFITLAAEGGAPLDLIQREVGHADPRTTSSYIRRRNDLDDNASDYIHL